MIRMPQTKQTPTILWVDDEIDLLRPYVLFLSEKGYAVHCFNNGRDALEVCRQQAFDLIFLDENMPGLSGLQVLEQLHDVAPFVPVVMITKNEDEGIMNQAIGNRITDYLIKPVNPNQIWLTIKKNLNRNEMISEITTASYRDAYHQLDTRINACQTATDWKALYVDLLKWQNALWDGDEALLQLWRAQMMMANQQFGKFISQTYSRWIAGNSDHLPTMSHTFFAETILPILRQQRPLFWVVIDNFRFDQWLAIKPHMAKSFAISEDAYFSILPTTTQYARNALLSGLLPAQIAKSYPEWWADEADEGSKNAHEEQLLRHLLERHGMDLSFSYHKISSVAESNQLVAKFRQLMSNQLNVCIYNFIDMLSHTRTESEIIRNMTSDNKAYLSLTESWFEHSSLLELLQKVAETDAQVILTTDHGTIQVGTPIVMVSEKQTSTNLRYKVGRHMTVKSKALVEVEHPSTYGLPASGVASRYVLAQNDGYFVYPNQANKYITHYDKTFQHGGISLDEMVVPSVVLTPK